MRVVSMLPLLFCLITNAHATCILAVLTPTTIIVGADSKVNRGDHSETWKSCKIGSANNIFWGKSRILEVPAWHFNVDEIATSVMSKGGAFLSRVAAFETEIIPPLTQILNALKIGDRDWFTKNYEGKTALEVVFVASHLECCDAALAEYRRLCPDAPTDQRAASGQVNRMVAAAINADARWFWHGPDDLGGAAQRLAFVASGCHIWSMPLPDLTDNDRAILAQVLRECGIM